MELNFHDKTYCLVELFIERAKWEKWTNKDWSRERGATKRLLTRYPEFSFFYDLMDLQGKFNSLLGLLIPRNEVMLNERYRQFMVLYERNKKYGLEYNV